MAKDKIGTARTKTSQDRHPKSRELKDGPKPLKTYQRDKKDEKSKSDKGMSDGGKNRTIAEA